MKYFTLIVSIVLIFPSSAWADYIFEGPVQEFYRPDGYIRDVTVADFNSDGLSDLVVTYSNANSYETFLSNGDGTITSLGICATSPVGWNIHSGDINEDGNVDLIYIYSTLYLLLGYGDGSFGVPIELPPYCWSGYSSMKDLNSDGHLDVVTGHGDSVCVFLGNGLGGFEKSWGYCVNQSNFYYLSEIACDLDLDGAQDLICAYYIGGYCAIATFKGYGDGTFMNPVSYYPYPSNTAIEYVETGDFNEDSFPDIAGAGDAPLDQYAVAVFINQQDGTFLPSDSGYYEIGGSVQHGLEARDFDLNGHLDLSISGIGEIMPGYGNGYFSNDPDDLLLSFPLPFAGLLRAIDLDNDTDLDLVQAFEGFHHIKLYLNTTINLGVEEHESGSISDLLLEVSPNPFSSSVIVSASGFTSNPSDLQIFDLSGRLVTEIEPAFNGSEAVYQ
ncbi:MAG: T9SS type A sorting domain-containing protein [Candidatus Aegiribacteria sp.]|nr:T9SS type A sorting domain-containing protein [Candidatus Aegiribacteria sp.]